MSDTLNSTESAPVVDQALEDLKVEATELGLTFHPNISAAKLAARIEEKYNASAAESTVAVKTEGGTQGSTDAGNRSFMQYVAEQRVIANKTHIVTIIDNDSRINNVTTTCTVNCSNEYFDLGTVILPLNEKVEVRQGHLNTLAELRIPQHIKTQRDPNISSMVMRPRYTIQYHPEVER